MVFDLHVLHQMFRPSDLLKMQGRLPLLLLFSLYTDVSVLKTCCNCAPTPP